MKNEQSPAAGLFHQGVSQLAQGQLAEARRSFDAALELQPDLAEARANLAWVAALQGDDDLALRSYRLALQTSPGLYQVRLNFGALLMKLRQLDDAEQQFSHAVVLRPDTPGGWSNLAGLYAAWPRDAEAELCARQALLRDPQHAMARLNLAYVLLRQGRWSEGWELLESRDWYSALQQRLSCPRWNGDALLGRSVLVAPEAGYGDVIQFSRYAALLRDRGAGAITLLCPPALQSLLGTLQGVDTVLAWDQPAATAWDCWVPLMSLPRIFETQVRTVPARLPYLSVPPPQRQRWQSWWRDTDAAVAAGPQAAPPGQRVPRVGLVWRGSSGFENDAERSLPSLTTLAPLWQVRGLRFVSLQKGAGEDEALAPPPGQELFSAGQLISDFADTAALIESVDLLISVDTSAAHLAGALGKPCWLLLPSYMTDWRWLQNRSDSPWYPDCMHIFRQQRRGDWSAVVDQVRRDLQVWAESLNSFAG